MKVKVSELSTQEEVFSCVFPPAWIKQILEQDAEQDRLTASLFFATDPIEMEVHLYRNEQEEVFFYGHAKGAVGFTCVRSLEEGKLPLDLDISGAFRPLRAGALDPEDEDPSLYSYSGDEIDFSDVVREQFLLALPFNPSLPDAEPLTLPAEVPPSNEEKPIDPRWSALQGLQEKLRKRPQ